MPLPVCAVPRRFRPAMCRRCPRIQSPSLPPVCVKRENCYTASREDAGTRPGGRFVANAK